MNPDYRNLDDILVRVYNHNCVNMSMNYRQLHLVVHSPVGHYHNQLLVMVLLHTIYAQLYLAGLRQVSDCHHQLLVMIDLVIVWP